MRVESISEITRTFAITRDEDTLKYVYPIAEIKNTIKALEMLGLKVERMTTAEPIYMDVDTDLFKAYKRYDATVLDRLWNDSRMNYPISLKIEKNRLYMTKYDTDVPVFDIEDRWAENKQISIRFVVQ